MRIRSRWLDWLLAATVVCACRLLFRTIKIHYLEAAANTNPYSTDGTEGFIYCVWHDVIAFPMFAGRHVKTVALVSKHHDGSSLSYGLQMLGIGLVRGSSSKHGASAVRELMRLPPTTHFVVTPDGPRGPEHQTKVGLVFLASRAGRSIVPTAFSAVRSWKIPGKWTSLVIPRPFTTIYALGGQPITVPGDADSQQLAQFDTQVQHAMDGLARKAEQLSAKRCRTSDEISAVLNAADPLPTVA